MQFQDFVGIYSENADHWNRAKCNTNTQLSARDIKKLLEELEDSLTRLQGLSIEITSRITSALSPTKAEEEKRLDSSAKCVLLIIMLRSQRQHYERQYSGTRFIAKGGHSYHVLETRTRGKPG